MKRENILVRMPKELDHFLAAAAVVQDYCVQLHKQVGMRQRNANFWFTVEVQDEAYLFFWHMFPRMELRLAEDIVNRGRWMWDCIIDLTDIERVRRIATVPKKQITEAWGIMVGSSPRALPDLGPLRPQGNDHPVDVLIDERVEGGEVLQEYFLNNFPNSRVVRRGMEGLRPGTLLHLLSECKLFIGLRGGATYLSVTMGKPTLELYPDDMPLEFMSKPQSDTYRIFYGSKFAVGMMWAVLEEVWDNVRGISGDEDLILQALTPMGGTNATIHPTRTATP
jgi:hypothetical protein